MSLGASSTCHAANGVPGDHRTTGAPDGKVQKLTITGLHLCCAKCVKAVDKAVMGVSGVTTQTAVKGAKTFDITGNFSAKEVFASLQKEGLTGKVK